MEKILRERYLVASIIIDSFLFLFNLMRFLTVSTISKGLSEVVNMTKITALALIPLIGMIIYAYIKEREYFSFHMKLFVKSVMSIFILNTITYFINISTPY